MKWLRKVYKRWCVVRDIKKHFNVRMPTRFRPCLHFTDDLDLTTVTLEDVETVWVPAFSSVPHTVDVGFAADDGRIVAVQIWRDVRNRNNMRELS